MPLDEKSQKKINELSTRLTEKIGPLKEEYKKLLKCRQELEALKGIEIDDPKNPGHKKVLQTVGPGGKEMSDKLIAEKLDELTEKANNLLS